MVQRGGCVSTARHPRRLVLPYAFAWVGHFFFEHNRPASFIYPTYSLLGDLRMFAGMATGEVPW